MVSIWDALHVRQFQELNEPQIFSWRYLPRKCHVHRVYEVRLDTLTNGVKVEPIRIVVTLKWRNKARRVAELMAFDERHGYCLLGREDLPRGACPDVGLICRKHAQAYLHRLHAVARGVADPLHEDSRHRYQEYKAILRKKLWGAEQRGKRN